MRERLAAHHRESLADLLGRTPEFSPDDVVVALELIDDALAGGPDYRFLVDTEGGIAQGYVCFGATAMTEGTYDLYWICVDPDKKGRGIGRALVAEMEREIARDGARLVRVETAGSAEYAATRAFYERAGYEIVATIRDFYRSGNALVIYGHYLQPVATAG